MLVPWLTQQGLPKLSLVTQWWEHWPWYPTAWCLGCFGLLTLFRSSPCTRKVISPVVGVFYRAVTRVCENKYVTLWKCFTNLRNRTWHYSLEPKETIYSAFVYSDNDVFTYLGTKLRILEQWFPKVDRTRGLLIWAQN